MSDLKPTGSKIKLGNNEYGMRFTLNVIEDIQDHFNINVSDIDSLFSDERNQIKNIRYLLTVLINENIDCEDDETGEKTPHLDERYVGRHIDLANVGDMKAAIFSTASKGMPESDADSDYPTKSE
jgi:predicted metal-dependent enzyme (double-stranded beta helix superfamily)